MCRRTHGRKTLLRLIHPLNFPGVARPPTAAVLPRRFVSACRDGGIEGCSLAYRRTISVEDRPFFYLCVVDGAYRMVIVDAAAAPGIPVLRDREFDVGFAVGQPII